jgi:hypothetical protein
MKVVFVFPGISAMGFNSFGNPIFGYEASMIHHGLRSARVYDRSRGSQVPLVELSVPGSRVPFVLGVERANPIRWASPP